MCLVNEHRFKLLTFMLRGAREGVVSNIEVSGGMAFIPFRSSTWKKGQFEFYLEKPVSSVVSGNHVPVSSGFFNCISLKMDHAIINIGGRE